MKARAGRYFPTTRASARHPSLHRRFLTGPLSGTAVLWRGNGQYGAMIAAFSITPLGIGESVGDLVAEAVRLVRESGLPNETNAMFTNVEGDWDEVMTLLKSCVMRVAEGAPRVSVVIKIDHRPGVTGALTGKVQAVERRLTTG